MATNEETKKAYPGVEIGYDFVLPSYEWMLTRMDAADARIQTLQNFSITFTLAVPAAAKALNSRIEVTDWRFLLAIALFIALSIVGLVEQLNPAIKVANPNIIFNEWLELDEWEFKKDAIARAGEHFEYNANYLVRRARANAWMTGLFLAELLSLLGWVVTAPTV